MAVTGNSFIILLNAYFFSYIVKLIFNRRIRETTISTNIGLDEMRKIPVKSLEEQKKFIDLKFPKSPNRKFEWKNLPSIIFNIVKEIGLFLLCMLPTIFILKSMGLLLPIWVGVVYIIVAPIMFNLVLERFGVHKSDLRQFLKW